MRLHELLLRLYPEDVRRHDGDAMLETIEQRLRLAGSRSGRLAVAVREAAGLAVGALRARLGAVPLSQIPSTGPRMLQGLWQDARYTLRTARRDPGVTAVILLTLALGIGANVAIFSVVHGVLLEPLPYADPDQLLRLDNGGGTVTKAIQHRLRQSMSTLQDVSAYTGWGVTVGGTDDPEVLIGGLVSTNHFDLLGAPAAAVGRTFVPEDAEPGNDDVAVLSWGLWQRRFGGDPAVVGERLPIDNEQHPSRIVIGVMPADYRPIDDWDVWMPYRVDPTDEEEFFNSWYLKLLGRSEPGVDAVAVTAELRQQFELLSGDERYGLDDPEVIATVTATGLRDAIVGPVRETLLVLFAAVGLVLVIASFNVANLMLARSARRRRELAVRTALGAPKGRLLRQLLTEAVLLSGAGAALGALGAWAAIGLLRSGLAGALPRTHAIAVDAPVLLFAAGLAVLTGLLFGTAPSLLFLRHGPGQGLAGGRGVGSEGVARASRALVIVEVAMACVVVVGAGLMVRTLDSLWSVSPGFDPEGVAVARATATNARYPGQADRRGFWQAAIRQVSAAPGIDSAAAIHLLPLQEGNWGFSFRPEGHVIAEDEPLPVANFRVVTPGYFRTMGISLLQGRDFDERDGAEGPGALIINRRMAEELWPGESPLGKRIDIFGRDETRVVGVVDDVRQFRLQMEPAMEMYRPAAQWPLASMVVVTRSNDPRRALRSIETAVHEVDAAVPVHDGATMEEVMARSLSFTRLAVNLLSGFALLALILGVVGIYGVMSYLVAGRNREIGIRMALGAPGHRVWRTVVASALRAVGLGVILGLAGAVVTLRLMASLLYGVEPVDPLTYGSVAVAMVLTGLVAGWVPARRASRVDPLDALRAE